MKKFFENTYTIKNSLRTRLLVFFLILTVVPTILSGLLSFRISSDIVYKMAIESSQELIDRIGSELNSLFSDSIYFMDHVQTIESLQEGLRGDADSLDRPYLVDLSVNTELRFITDYKEEIFGLYVIGNNNRKYKSNYNFFSGVDLSKSPWYDEILNSDVLKVLGPYNDSMVVKTAYSWKMDFFALGAPFIDRSSGENTGIILAEIKEDLIEEIIDAKLGKTGYILILDGRNHIVLAPEKYNGTVDFSALPVLEPKKFNQLIVNQRFIDNDELEETILINQRDNILFCKILNIPNWKIMGVIPNREFRTDKDNTIRFIILIPVLSCLAAAFVAWKVSAGIVRPVSHLSMLMRKVEEGNLQVEINDPGSDEIGRLGRSFNVMIEKLRESMDQIYQSQGQMRKTELQLLQAQINPHFLYNTLDAIKYLAKANENKKVVTMVVSLARFFRSSLSKGMAVITLEEELDRTENYLRILKLRYNDRFDYHISLPSGLQRQRILKLLLQPIVENAVYHGIKEKPGPGAIYIRAYSHDGNCIVTVEDTGAGMSAEKLAELEYSIHQNSAPAGESYGLRNVQERIKIFFGSGYGISVQSSIGEGTIVTIKIPGDNEENYID